MNTASEPEHNDNLVIYDRSSERRRGVDRRKEGQVKNKESPITAEKSEESKPLEQNKFIGDFG
jgi:hypothetical protein